MFAMLALLCAQDVVLQEGEARLVSQNIEVEIHQRVAVTRLTQVFHNPAGRPGEGVYNFLLPGEGTLIDFQMWIGDRIMKGELLDRDRATRVYNEIVSKLRDPGIVEQIDDRRFRVRVFPIPPNGNMKFQVTYVEILPIDDMTATYTLPLRIPGDKARQLDAFGISVHIVGATEVKDVASSHKIDIQRKSALEVRASMERNGNVLDKDFTLTYKIADGELDMALAAHRLAGEDGHFVLVITPSALKARALPKEVLYLVDASDSIDEKVFEQVKKGVYESIKNLSALDRFNIVAFHSSASRFAKESVAPGKENLAAAAKFLEKLEPDGRTDLEEALKAVLETPSDHPRLVLLISDGSASAGLLSGRALLAKTLEKLDRNTVFFGVRLGPATPERLLETLAERTGGVTIGAADEKDVLAAIARIHKRMAIPVMTDVSLDFGDAQVYGAHPDNLRIVFANDQPLIVGRYKKPGDHRVTMKGNVDGKPVTLWKSCHFSENEKGWGAAAFLWGGAEIRSLLASVAAQGESTELVTQLVRLSKTYRIVTPYTAFLVLENDEMYAQYGLERTIEEERRLFKKRKKKVSTEPGQGGVDLPSATPGVKPVDPLKSNTADRSIVAALKWLTTARTSGLWKSAAVGELKLDEVGVYALSFLAFTGAYDYELQPADQALFEGAVSEAVAAFAKRQNPNTGLIGANLLNHALAAHALAELYTQKRDPRIREILQKALAYLSDNPQTNPDLPTTAFSVLALTAAQDLGLEVDRSVLKGAEKFLADVATDSAVYDTRAHGRTAPLYDALWIRARLALSENADVRAAAMRLAKAKPDPELATFGTIALLQWKGTRSREWAAWGKNLDAWLKKDELRIDTNGSWLPKGWREESRSAATALRVLATESFERRVDY